MCASTNPVASMHDPAYDGPGAMRDRVEAELAQRGRSERHLRGLLHTAQRLLASREAEQMLSVIVDAAQQLCGSDVAHINLLGTLGEFEVQRATTGARSETFRRQQGPKGHGLTDHIVRTKEAYFSEDYLNDSKIRHSPQGIASVAADGLVSMAGVPVISGKDVIAVLAISWRQRATVTSEWMDVLYSLASLASVTLTSARQDAERLRALRELKAAYETVQAHRDAQEWSAWAHDQLISKLLAKGDVSAIPATVHELLSTAAYLYAPDGSLLGAATDTDHEYSPPALDVEAIEQTRSEGRLTRLTTKTGAFLAVPAMASGDLLGIIVISASTVSELAARTLERAGMAAALLLMTRRRVLDAEFRSASEVIENLVRGTRLAVAREQAQSLGLTFETPYIVVVTSRMTKRHDAIPVARHFAEAHHGIFGELDQRLVVILPGHDADPPASEFARLLNPFEAGLAVGSARVPPNGSFGEAYSEARLCIHALGRLGRTGVATSATLGFLGLLIGADKPSAAVQYIERTIGPLLTYDQSRGTQLVETLRSYIRHNGSLRLAGDALHVHPNTVQQRLQRIGELLGTDIRDPDFAFELQIALRLRTIDEALDEFET